ncbi:MAG: DUF262 domain-containing protein [Actinobacteria bacterium]|nr:DUF262 domain-containing protein [Actinomycetota bacterium]
MLTEVKQPRQVFYMPQRLLVPLFQRPYVWSREGQWELLWSDVQRVAEKVCLNEIPAPHFLGAVVLQQQSGEIGALPVRTIIDGQQRLTTLQLLLDAVYEEVSQAGFEAIAKQVVDLVENAEHYLKDPEDRYKVWPTNRDRQAFNEVMSAQSPIDYQALENSSSKMVQAHEYFAIQARTWIADGANFAERANALVQTVSSYLQLVVIELMADEDAQEIFETLNARGTPLTAADLIKNLLFQKLDAAPGQAEKAYHQFWETFETPFWETEVSSGRVNYSRSSLFLNQWLISKTALEIPAREVFAQFKRFVNEYDGEILDLLQEVSDAAATYKSFTDGSQKSDGDLSRVELFVYRTATLESEAAKPLLIWLLDSTLEVVPDSQIVKALDVIESWMVRRSCVRATTKNYNKVFVSLLNELKQANRSLIGDRVEAFFVSKASDSDYWPGDEEVRAELIRQPIYTKIRRARLRMILEAIEDNRRGFNTARPLHEQRVVRGKCTVEHLMPQEWITNWPNTNEDEGARKRDAIIHTLGNLTLLTQGLNSKVSNGPWLGENGKREALIANTSLKLTQEVVSESDWTEVKISTRTEQMIEDVVSIWPVPIGHLGRVVSETATAKTTIAIADLIQAGMLSVGQELYSRKPAHEGRSARVGSDGRLFLEDKAYESPSGAARGLTGSLSEAGWWFWLVDTEGTTCLSDLRRDYLEMHDESDSGDSAE